MHLPPQPDSRELLPPLLACLPTAFLAPRPPPALLPLLAPVLRQKLNYISSGNDGWLPLLSWDKERAAKLPATVERIQVEPHPVSGEIEFEDVRPAKYRRLDQETLQARLEVEQFDLLPIYVWCENDEHGGTGPGWKLTELRCLEDLEDGTEWFDTASEANDAAQTRSTAAPQTTNGPNGNPTLSVPDEADDDDDDDYWNAYDRTPSQTPGQNPSPAPAQPPTSTTRGRTQSETEYFSRYGEVQPALDNHDPDEDNPALTSDSTLTGDALLRAQARHLETSGTIPPNLNPSTSSTSQGQASNKPHDSALASLDRSLEMPRPLSPGSSSSGGGGSRVGRLEQEAEAMGRGGGGGGAGNESAQRAIKQHISTDIKSLFRLARSAGMKRAEFEELVRRELSVLCLLDEDDQEDDG
ncbi:hypothetical protein KC343_g962 [Hortaea werneckii]|uniref:Uncharacterized protein n=1 Tax=Hortaea werneckii TaxID=91943 RepID=A0A3M7ETB3_HORWE|nr:hypothetical protein KC352_g7215 [Hortaea werneckii]KAI7570334.1 hypothetical protein KC317_g2557 [Hortaea werneckii]KAI7627949.1 hypothetical protein KC346_g464 [Hortaea werneckii]KAI7636970.1 hypothetical protein KC343_g962 [Hortaea werneckii]KAI7683869.1 hypothetical protein KC319_g222 [Hortaea werneckii]